MLEIFRIQVVEASTSFWLLGAPKIGFLIAAMRLSGRLPGVELRASLCRPGVGALRDDPEVGSLDANPRGPSPEIMRTLCFCIGVYYNSRGQVLLI